VKIAVVGTGYVGLVAGACFADSGTHVTCVDVDEQKLEKLRRGEVPFFEPNLAELVKRNWPNRLDFTSNLAQAIDGREVVFIAVGTPPLEDGSADLSTVLAVAEQVAKTAKHDLALVTKSTVPVGTNEKVREVVRKHAKHHISVVSNPEFLKEGDAVNDFLKPDRIVVGTDDDKAFEALSRLYAPVQPAAQPPAAHEPEERGDREVRGERDARDQDLVHERDRAPVRRGRRRRGARAASPWARTSASACSSSTRGSASAAAASRKDLRALVHTGEELGVELAVAQSAVKANEGPVTFLLRHMEGDLGGLKDKVIAVWGLAFKPRTDDVREGARHPADSRDHQARRPRAGNGSGGARHLAREPRALRRRRSGEADRKRVRGV
jgi:UDPglucose 6-dehydrogenase